MATSSPANLLLEGPRVDTEAILAPLMRGLSPVVACSAADLATFFAHGEASSSIAVRHVDRLTVAEQDGLGRWLSTAREGMRVIATSTTPLFAQVTEGRFSRALYYRLNTLLYRVTS